MTRKRNKIPFLVLVGMLFCLFIFWGSYELFGHAIVQDMYEGKSFYALNQIIGHHQSRPLAEYLARADRAFWNCMSFMIVGVCVSAVLLFVPLTRNCLGTFFKRSEVLAVLVGCVFCVILIVLAELGGRLFYNRESGFERSYSQRYFVWNSDGLIKPRPGRHQSAAISKKTGQTIYDVEYSIDPFGRRLTPVQHKEAART